MKITPLLFEAFLNCPTHCWLNATGERPSGNAYAEWVQVQTETYRTIETERLLAETPSSESARSPFAENLKTGKWRLAVDVAVRTPELPCSSRREEAHSSLSQVSTLNAQPSDHNLVSLAAADQGAASPITFTAETRLHAVERVPSEGRGKATQFIPIRFIGRNKLTKNDRLLLAFDAFVLSALLGRDIAVGKIIHGFLCGCDRKSAANSGSEPEAEDLRPVTAAFSRAQPRVLKVKTSYLVGEVRKRLEKISALLSSSTPPDLVLNRHCGECEFQARCRRIAMEKDDLSLLSGMSAKERQNLRSKGIFTITQLSYTFRPRRRPKRQRDKQEKYHPSLKALAIREKKIHILGSPELKIVGTPVYLDVEGLPDRDFYYLIGLRIGHGDSAIQHSLWADTIEEEGKIWNEFLAIIETVEKPVLIYYGSYETIFLRRMSKRHGIREGSVDAKSICSTVNLLSFIFARIYFPTYSNRLKDIAGWLGFNWSENEPSGTWAVCLRYQWERHQFPRFRERIMNYNTEDCAALDTLVTVLNNLSGQPTTYSDVDFLNIPKTPATERGKELHRHLDNVLKSAHEDYENRKISLRRTNITEGSEAEKPKSRKKAPRRKLLARGGRRVRVPRKRTCQRHPDQPTLLKPARRESEHALLDLSFTNGGCKKVVIHYFGRRGYCPRCHSTYPPPGVKRILNQLFGSGFQTWSVYLRVALRLSVRLIAKVTQDLFGEDDNASDNFAVYQALIRRARRHRGSAPPSNPLQFCNPHRRDKDKHTWLSAIRLGADRRKSRCLPAHSRSGNRLFTRSSIQV